MTFETVLDFKTLTALVYAKFNSIALAELFSLDTWDISCAERSEFVKGLSSRVDKVRCGIKWRSSISFENPAELFFMIDELASYIYKSAGLSGITIEETSDFEGVIENLHIVHCTESVDGWDTIIKT